MMLQSPRKLSSSKTLNRSKTMPPEAILSSTHEKTDFVKFTKFLALKAVQIIIDSRKGAKIETKCKTTSSDIDWFNLSIHDSIEVTKATKKAFNDDVLNTFLTNLNVEISLKTSDNDEMVLETWTLGLDQSQIDPTLKAMSTVYYRMGILLKSLVSVSRITPAYKLSRRQETDSYKILYQIYTGGTCIENLGDGYKQVKVGQLKTPLGAVFIMVSYRTNMIISPNKIPINSSIILKSDHFELSPKHVIYKTSNKKNNKNEKSLDLSKPLRAAAFVDSNIIQQMMINFHKKLPTPRRRNSLPKTKIDNEIVGDVNENESVACKNEVLNSEYPPQKHSTNHLKLLFCPFADPNPIRELAEFYKDFFNAPNLNLSLKADILFEPFIFNDEIKSKKCNEAVVELPKQLKDFENLANEFDDMLASMHCSEESS